MIDNQKKLRISGLNLFAHHLLVETIHRINAKADQRVEEVLLDDLRRVTGKTNILFQLADATLAHPDSIVRDVVFPIVSETLPDTLWLSLKQ